MKRVLWSDVLWLSFVWLFVHCTTEEDLNGNVCTDPIEIKEFRPDRNPAASPVMIVGSNFSPSMSIRFDNISAIVEYVSPQVIVTRIPEDFSGIDTEIDLILTDENCELESTYHIVPTFPDYERANPPYIHFPDENRKISITLDQYVGEDEFSCRFVRNIWGFNQTLCIDQISLAVRNRVDFNGHEEINSFFHRVNSFTGSYDMQAMELSLEVSYLENLDEEPMNKDILHGAFYDDEIMTPGGFTQMEYLFLESDVTGRQYMFSIIP